MKVFLDQLIDRGSGQCVTLIDVNEGIDSEIFWVEAEQDDMIAQNS